MGKRMNVLLSDEAIDIIKLYQKNNNIANRDTAVEQFILENGEKAEEGKTKVKKITK